MCLFIVICPSNVPCLLTFTFTNSTFPISWDKLNLFDSTSIINLLLFDSLINWGNKLSFIFPSNITPLFEYILPSPIILLFFSEVPWKINSGKSKFWKNILIFDAFS